MVCSRQIKLDQVEETPFPRWGHAHYASVVGSLSLPTAGPVRQPLLGQGRRESAEAREGGPGGREHQAWTDQLLSGPL